MLPVYASKEDDLNVKEEDILSGNYQIWEALL